MPSVPAPTLARVPVAAARRLLLAGQDLLSDPTRRATRAALAATIERLGFVQVDSIQAVERAHHLTLHSRLDGYRPAQLTRMVEVDRALFEHWTHDASLIPTGLYAHWKPRFRRDAARLRNRGWWTQALGGEPEAVLAAVLGRIAREGPLRASDFEHPGARGQWWDWKPPKAALEFLWRAGELAVPRRDNFEKVYDLAARALPDHHALAEPSADEHLEWACGSALARLGVATAAELAGYWDAVSLADARAWCAREIAAGRVAAVTVEGDRPRPAVALPDWQARARRLPDAPARLRLLCPFDPVLRDRDRALRLFGFDYRFEAYVPAARRKHGYYVMPVLEGEALVGRVDPKLHRDRGLLELRGVWWEPGVRPTAARRRGLEEAVARLATFCGADHYTLPARA